MHRIPQIKCIHLADEQRILMHSVLFQWMKMNYGASKRHSSVRLDRMARRSAKMHSCKMFSPRAFQRCWPTGCIVRAVAHRKALHSKSFFAVWCCWRAASPMRKSSKFNSFDLICDFRSIQSPPGHFGLLLIMEKHVQSCGIQRKQLPFRHDIHTSERKKSLAAADILCK